MTFKVYAVAAGQNSNNQFTGVMDTDSSGAFVPGAQRFAAAYKGTYKTFDNSKNSNRNFLQAVNAAPDNLDVFAYFGHGCKTQLGSASINNDADIENFAKVLRTKLKPSSTVVLYACWAGYEAGFSTMLQRKLGTQVWVYGHRSLGHSFANPDVTEVQKERNPEFKVLDFRSADPMKDLYDPWCVALMYTDMWLRFPLMWNEFINRELFAIRLLGTWRIGSSNTTYLFEWSRKPGTYDDLGSLNVNPSGTVSVVGDRNRKGSWTINEALRIEWQSGDKETWPLPLISKGTRAKISGIEVNVVRLKRNNPGKIQC
jgi:hypothetical protein